MKFKGIARRLVATATLVCICCGLAGGMVYGASSGSGYDSGVDYRELTPKQIKSWYVGDFGIFSHLSDPNGYVTSSKSYNDVQISYNSFQSASNNGNIGTDYKVYTIFSSFSSSKKTAKWKLKDFIKEDGSGKLFDTLGTVSSNGYADSTGKIKKHLTPDNCNLYHPLNVLRLIQMYLVTEKRQYIGGWPVQVKTSNSSKFNIQGARTIKIVYKAFTGKSYSGPASHKDPTEGTNYVKNSIYGKLLDGNIKFDEAAEQLVEKLKSSNVMIWDHEDLMTNGNMTYEEYLSLCFRGELGTANVAIEGSGQVGLTRVDYEASKSDDDQFQGNNEVVTDDRYFRSKLNSPKKIGKMPMHDQRELFYNAVFRYLEEYGIHFHSFQQSQDGGDDVKSIFKKDSGGRYANARRPILEKKSNNHQNDINNFKVCNLNANDPVGKVVGEKLKSAFSDCYGTKANKPKMYDIASEIISAMKGAVSDEELQKYFAKDPDSNLGDPLTKLSQGTSLDNSTLNKVRDKAAKVAKGLNGLNKIDDVYVVKFFLDLCAKGGQSGNTGVDMEYTKIMNILNRKNVKKGKQSLSDCFTMMYSLDRIGKCGKEYTMTFNARNSAQINSILKYSETEMPRIYKYFKADKGDSNNETIDAYRNPELKDNQNALQHYSDYAECSTAIKVLGAKVYKTSTGYDGEAAYEKFRTAYSNWLKNQKTGMTKNEKGVQHQDGFLPYALSGDSDELKESSKKYFSEKANSPDGKNVVKDSDSDSKKQDKIWKWKIDTDEFNEALKTNFWVKLTNGLLAIVGNLMFAACFVYASIYGFDMVSNGYYNITNKATFGKWDYIDDRKENIRVLGKLCVGLFFAALIATGVAFKWTVLIYNIAYRALTTK